MKAGKKRTGLAGNRSEALALYRMARLIRRTEEVLAAEYHPADQMRCPMHFCTGQEAMPAALAQLLRPHDHLASHYRSHGYYLAKGAPLAAMVAEFYGKASGSNSGIAGSMELGSHEHHFYSGAIVAGPIGLALGSAFAQRYRRSKAISVAVMGDGAMDEGVTYESINLAVIWQLPLLVICENNGYAAYTRLARRAASALHPRARAFGMRAGSYDGNNPALLLSQLKPVIADIRAGKGPYFFEIETYRIAGHVGPEGDGDMGYRPAKEVERWKRRDPVKSARQAVLASGVAAKSIAELDCAIEAEVAEAVRVAKAAPFPKPGSAERQIASNTYSPVVREFASAPAGDFDAWQAETRLKGF